MAKGNKGFADLIAASGEAARVVPRLPPRTGILSGRENRLAEMAAGGMVTRVHELVDPARCRIWEGHNRDYAALSEDNCADLIESFKAQGRQEVPAIVRRIADDPAHDYEIICGARRHWTVSWLRSHSYPEFRFLIEPRELTDEEAFRLADLENRNRRDLSDFERASDYARAIDRYYGGSQQRMVERLEVTKSWLSRYLELARLPPEVVASFGSPHVLGISHAASLAPLLRAGDSREKVIAAAAALAEEQASLAAQGGAHLPPGVVLRRLTGAATTRAALPSREILIRDEDGMTVLRAIRGRGGALSISLPAPTRDNRSKLLRALEELVDANLREGKGKRR